MTILIVASTAYLAFLVYSYINYRKDRFNSKTYHIVNMIVMLAALVSLTVITYKYGIKGHILGFVFLTLALILTIFKIYRLKRKNA